MISEIMWFGEKAIIECDGNCDQAWGINWQGEKGQIAPADTGWYEGGHGKPTDARHNKWCARECERSKISMLA